jgi:hypothetical protein
MKQKLYTQESFPSNKADLIERFLTIWDELNLELLENLSNSISGRLEKVIKNKGGWIYFFLSFMLVKKRVKNTRHKQYIQFVKNRHSNKLFRRFLDSTEHFRDQAHCCLL